VDFLFIILQVGELKKYLQPLSAALLKYSVKMELKGERLLLSSKQQTISFKILFEQGADDVQDEGMVIPIDLLMRDQLKMVSGFLSKLQLNTVVYARNCQVEKISKVVAEEFLNTYHVLNKTSSGFNLGLFYKKELVAVASFSKGRKMNRLAADLRSFELIRFCSKSGITVAGGLTKILQHFIISKNAGDIMTYIDKQFSDGSSFLKSGFKLHSQTAPQTFLIDRKTFKRFPSIQFKEVDDKKYYLFTDAGNLKMVFSPKR